jgi:hypothetical protein
VSKESKRALKKEPRKSEREKAATGKMEILFVFLVVYLPRKNGEKVRLFSIVEYIYFSLINARLVKMQDQKVDNNVNMKQRRGEGYKIKKTENRFWKDFYFDRHTKWGFYIKWYRICKFIISPL